MGCSCGLAIQQQLFKAHTRGKRHRQLLAELQARRDTDQLGVIPVPVSSLTLPVLFFGP